MSRKKSVKLAAMTFVSSSDDIFRFFQSTEKLDAKYHPWTADYAIIRLYGSFEVLMLKALVGAINNDTDTLFQTSGFKFPKHLNQDVCTYLVVGTKYFDFRGRDGLIDVLRKFVPPTHYLLLVAKAQKYKDALEKLIALRNFAAHQSEKAKKAAIMAIGGHNLGSAGAWLRKKDRFEEIHLSLKKFAYEIERKAPY